MTNAETRFNNSLRPRKPEGSLRRTAQDVHLDSHTAPELSTQIVRGVSIIATHSAMPAQIILAKVIVRIVTEILFSSPAEETA